MATDVTVRRHTKTPRPFVDIAMDDAWATRVDGRAIDDESMMTSHGIHQPLIACVHPLTRVIRTSPTATHRTHRRRAHCRAFRECTGAQSVQWPAHARTH